MAGVIERFPDQIRFALADPDLPRLPRAGFARAVVLGMGGSALPADVLRTAFAAGLRAPLEVSRDYRAPQRLDADTIVVACSFSGNTEETLAAVSEAAASPATIVALSSGGKLRDLALERGWPFVRVPAERESRGFQPRCAVGYVMTYLARLLAGCGVLEDASDALASVVGWLEKLETRPAAEAVAADIGQRIPIFYCDQPLRNAVARITKIKVNENAKRPAFYNSFPETSHNELVGFERVLGDLACIYLRDPASHPRVQLQLRVVERVLQEKYGDRVLFRTWDIPGSTTLEKVLAALQFGDWLSYSLALADGLDPTPVAILDRFKSELLSD